MLKVKINARSLRKWGAKTKARGKRIKPALASTLNFVGDKYVEEMVRKLSAQTGIPEERVRRRLSVKRASEGSLRFEIDGSAALLQETARRPMRGRRDDFRRSGRDQDFFRQGELVNIVNMGDDRVCPVCEAAEENGPYTIEQARAMIPLHPNCRCVVEIKAGRRSAPMEFRERGEFQGGARLEPMADLLARMRQEISAVMRNG